MRYEIINPSDKCYITAENEKVACLCNLYLGNGMYGLKREDGSIADGVRIFDTESTLNEFFEGDFGKFADNHIDEIVACFASFEYAGERTSIYDIEARAKKFAEAFERKGVKND